MNFSELCDVADFPTRSVVALVRTALSEARAPLDKLLFCWRKEGIVHAAGMVEVKVLMAKSPLVDNWKVKREPNDQPS